MDWNAEGAKRVRYILRREIVCNQRELERRISEVGPPEWRVEPVYVSGGRKLLVRRKHVEVYPSGAGEFYYLSKADKGKVKELVEKKIGVYKRFIEIGLTERKLGGVAEKVYEEAMKEADNIVILGKTGDVKYVNGAECKRTIDQAGYDKISDKKFGVEVKNIREWAYPDSWEVWKALESCAELEVIPVYIARQIAYPTLKLFGEIGAVGYKTYRQFWDVRLMGELIEVREKFGFKDIVFPVDHEVGKEELPLVNVPVARDVDLFSKTIPKLAKENERKFEEVREKIKKYAKMGLSDDKCTYPKRGKIFKEFHREAYGQELTW